MVQFPMNGLAPGAHRARKLGFKTTLRRMQVHSLLKDSERRHLSADEISRLLFDQGVDITLTTVYRVLSDLEGAGLVKRQVFHQEKAVFEINDGHRHDHFVCIRCDRIEEFQDSQIEQVQRKVARNQEFNLNGCSLVLYGLCPTCQ